MRSADTRARQLVERSLVWDNHGCMPLRSADQKFLPQLSRYLNAGVGVVGLNVGLDPLPWHETVSNLANFRHWIAANARRYRLVETVSKIVEARRQRRLAVFFDIEGGSALNGQLSMVELYRDLGVRWMLIAYNRNNRLGGGCQDVDRGLTRFGRQVIDEMARVGITVCCTHTGFRTTMDVMRHTAKPVIFSHSNPLGVWRHKRNVRDEAILACASTGGVVGINGIGLFLGRNDNRPETLVSHIDYVAQLVGPEHVGLGLDYVFDTSDLDDFVRANPSTFPPEEGYASGICMVPPEKVRAIAAGLLGLGYRAADVRKILGGNFMRVARATWPRA